MKKLFTFLFTLLFITTIYGCGPSEEPLDPNNPIDYAAQLQLDTNDGKKWAEVTLHNGENGCIDGDTTHFNYDIDGTGITKARYNAIDTPESTGKIEPWGKKAAKFNKERLVNAISIIIQSEDGEWHVDSTGGRYLLWVWYKADEATPYRLLNLELVQEGLSKTKGYLDTSYGEIFGKAYNQAITLGLKYYGKEKDDGYDYGAYSQVTIKEIKDHYFNYKTQAKDENGELLEPEFIYADKNVRFEGVVSYEAGDNTVYMMDYDLETETYYGITIYYGFNFSGEKLMKEGNRLSVACKLTDRDPYGLQASDLAYFAYSQENEKTIRLIERDCEVPTVTLTAKEYAEHGLESLDLNIKMNDLLVTDVYTTTAETSTSIGAMTLTCKGNDDVVVTIRTDVLYDDSGKLITAEQYEGKTIDIFGIGDEYEGKYQVHVFFANDIVIH